MQPITNQDIAARAYQLWEEEGRPHGRDLDHWEKAASELTTNGNGHGVANGNGTSNGKSKAPKKAAAVTAAEPDAPAKPKRKSTKAAK